MHKNLYLMENEDEIKRLELKTESRVVEEQALWAGLKPGMHVADIGCGTGKTTFILHSLSQPGGKATGFDISDERINFAKEKYKIEGIEFKTFNITEPFPKEYKFDFIWIRFILEYYRKEAFEIVKNISNAIKPGGILCLIDLDHNCLNHYGLSKKLENTLIQAIKLLEEKANFDPYVGRKLYSFLYDLGYTDIEVQVRAHHLIYGEIKEKDAFNWLKKIEVISKKIDFDFSEYKGGYEGFLREFKEFFTNPRRFTYTPIILCRGKKSKSN